MLGRKGNQLELFCIESPKSFEFSLKSWLIKICFHPFLVARSWSIAESSRTDSESIWPSFSSRSNNLCRCRTLNIADKNRSSLTSKCARRPHRNKRSSDRSLTPPLPVLQTLNQRWPESELPAPKTHRKSSSQHPSPATVAATSSSELLPKI